MSTQPIPIKQEPPKPLHLVAKLAEIVREIDHVEKSGRNDFQKYNYVKAADVAWLVRKALSERNIYLVSDVVEIRNYEIPAREGVMQAVDIKMQFSFFDGDSPETAPIVLHSFGTGTDKGDKAVYKAMTGALKYGLRHAFLIPDESDPEGDEKTDKQTAAAKKFVEEEVERQKAGKKPRSVPSGAEQPITVDTLFYVYETNGHFAEFTNLKAYGSGLNPTAAEGLRRIFSRYLNAPALKKDQLKVAREHMDALLEELKGVDVKTYEGKPL